MSNYHFQEHHLLLREQVRRMVERHVAPIASEIDETNRFPEELVEVFGDMGLLQLWVPQAYGGPGADLTAVCIVKEEIAKVSESAALLAANNSFGLVLPILNFGSEAQKRHYLGLAAKGRTLTAVAITEAGTGSDVSSMKTRAVRDGESWVLNGGKIYITFGSVAHFILVFARTSEGRGANGISAFLVDTRTPGFSFGKEDRKMGIRGVPNVPIFFDNLRVPAENMIGPEGQAFRACMRILDLNRPTIGAISVGLAQGAIDQATAYGRERKQFGQAITEFQGIQFMLADMQMQTEAARCLLYDCTRMADNQEWDGFSAKASMVKCFCSDTAMKVTTDAVQIFGGAGYMRDFPVERFMRDAKINQIFEGTNQIQRLVIARDMLAELTMAASKKIVDLDTALAVVKDGMTVAIGGWIFHGQPMALVRGLVRRGVRDLSLVPAPGSIAPDMLIGAGCVKETACVFISFEHLGLAPNFRRAAQSGALKVLEMDGPGIAGGLRAGACDLPYGLIHDLGTDLPRVNPQGYRTARVQEGSRPLLEVPAIKPDVLLLHGQQADEEGNVQYFGAGYFDLLFAQAARHVICSVDRLVPTSTVRSSARLTKIPSAFVHSVVVTPFGAHPGGSPGLYAQDERHLKAYVAASRDQASFEAYLGAHVRAGDEAAYREKIGATALATLTAGEAA